MKKPLCENPVIENNRENRLILNLLARHEIDGKQGVFAKLIDTDVFEVDWQTLKIWKDNTPFYQLLIKLMGDKSWAKVEAWMKQAKFNEAVSLKVSPKNYFSNHGGGLIRRKST